MSMSPTVKRALDWLAVKARAESVAAGAADRLTPEGDTRHELARAEHDEAYDLYNRACRAPRTDGVTAV